MKTNLGCLKIQAHFGRAFLVSCGFTSPPFFCRCCHYFRLNILKTSAKVRGHLLVWDFKNLISSPSLLTIHSIRLDGCLEIVRSEIFFQRIFFSIFSSQNYCISSPHNFETVREIQNNPTATLRVGRFVLTF